MRSAWRSAWGWPPLHAPGQLQQLCCDPAAWVWRIKSHIAANQALSKVYSQPNCPQHHASYASEAKPDADWRQHTRTQFSIRPSLMSPLYSTYQQEIQKDHRRQAVSNLLDAHNLLASEIDGLDAAQVERTAVHRAASLQQLSRSLRSLANRTNLPTCRDRSIMLGFYLLLEQQLGAGQRADTAAAKGQLGGRAGQWPGLAGIDGAPEQGVDDAQLYYEVSHGKVSVWEAWDRQFAQRYAGTPSLPPLDEIYAAEQRISKGRANSAAMATGGAEALDKVDGSQKGSESLEPARHGARMDLTGMVTAEGKRKTSQAKLRLREGHGRITVNGLPYDLYFPELGHRAAMLAPLLQMPQHATSFNVEVEVSGGGKSSQAQAVRTGLARGLLLFTSLVKSAEDRAVLRRLAVWDGRQVERKKPGQPKARKSFTYVRR